MPKTRKPGWHYMYSEELHQEIAVSERTGWVFCEDGTKYSPKEIEAIKASGGIIELQAHIVKRTFEGELLNGKPGSNQREHAPTAIGSGSNNSKAIDQHISQRAEGMQNTATGQLDIF